MKILKLEYLNINLKLFSVFLSLALMLLSLSFLNFQSIYSQSSEDAKSQNCEDNKDQSRYVSNVVLANKSGGAGLITDDLPGFHYVKKFDSNGTLISAFGTKGIGPGQFLHAHGIAVDSSGNVYVSDAEKCNIQKFGSEGNFIKMWGTKGTDPGQFLQPESMAVDSEGNLFVVDHVNQRVQKFDSKGNFVTMWGTKGTGSNEFEKPWGVAVDSKGNVYVSDQKNPVVQRFSNDGKFISKWGSYGTGNEQFVHLHDVTADSNDFVYVTDGRDNSRVAKFDSQGSFITKWGSFGSGNSRFIEDHGIATDKSDNVYVVDTRNARIQKFDSQGNFITKWGSFGCRDNQFLIPHDIAIDSSGNIYVTDSGNVHFLDGETCQSFEGNNWTTTMRKIFTSTMSGDEQVPPVDTNVIGHMSFTVPQDESEIKYKINITGSSDISSAYIHIGKKGENGEPIVDLLNDSKKNKMKQQTGIVIRGEVLDFELIGPMKGKTFRDLIFAMSDGETYVNVNTPTHIKGEIRGQIEVPNENKGG